MKKIKLLTSLAGIHFCFVRNDVIERDDAEAERLIDAGYGKAAPDDAAITAAEPLEAAPGDTDLAAAQAVKPDTQPADAPGKAAAKTKA